MSEYDPPIVPVKGTIATKTPIKSVLRQVEVSMIELAEQCQLCLLAFAELERFIRKIPPTSDSDRRDWNRIIWSKVQAVLAASSAISHLLWPNPDSRRSPEAVASTVQRGRMLRGFLSIGGDAPLLHREVRNAYEHIDERLDDWIGAIAGEIPLGWCISTLSEEEERGQGNDAFRYVNLNTMEVRVADAKCNLEDLAKMAADVRARIPLETGVVFQKVD